MFNINIKLFNDRTFSKEGVNRVDAANFLATTLNDLLVLLATNPCLPDVAQLFSNAGAALAKSNSYAESRAGIGSIEVTVA